MIIMVLVLPLILSSFGTNLATEIFFMAVFALSLGLIMGYTGLVSLGHAAFFGTGAYTVALLGEHIGNTYVLLLAALVFSGLLALISGALFIRTTGGYFLMITLAFGQMLFAFAFKMKSWTGGADGMQISVSPDFGFGPITSTHGLYYLAGVGFLLCYLLLLLFVNSPIGKIVKGIMENETRMKALGYQTRNYKLIAYSLSGTLAGFGGALYAFINSFVSPDLMFWIFFRAGAHYGHRRRSGNAAGACSRRRLLYHFAKLRQLLHRTLAAYNGDYFCGICALRARGHRAACFFSLGEKAGKGGRRKCRC